MLDVVNAMLYGGETRSTGQGRDRKRQREVVEACRSCFHTLQRTSERETACIHDMT